MRWFIVAGNGIWFALLVLRLSGILELPPDIAFSLNWPLFVLIATCWVALEVSAGTLKASLKRMFLGHGKSFKSDSALSPVAQLLIVIAGLAVAAASVYSRMKH